MLTTQLYSSVSKIAITITCAFLVSCGGGGGGGDSSKNDSASTTSEPPVQQAKPEKPTGFSAQAGDHRISFTWNHISGTTSYTVYYGTEPNIDPNDANVSKIGTITPKVRLSGLTNGTTYYAVLVGHNGAGNSAPTAEISATPLDPDNALSAPKDIRLVSKGSGYIELSWAASDGVDGYNVYYAKESGLTPSNYQGLDGGTALLNFTTTPSGRISNLDPNTEYHFIVTAYKGAVESAPSGPLSTSTTALVSVINDTAVIRGIQSSALQPDCSGNQITAQDCFHGRDAVFEDASNGSAGFDFTKLSATGSELSKNATDWACIRDNITGLTWENKTTTGIRKASDRYTWYNTNSATNGGGSGDSGTIGSCSISGNCNTENYISQINQSALCGISSWRLPIITELQGITDYDKILDANIGIDSSFFPHTQADLYWSETRDPFRTSTIVQGFNYAAGHPEIVAYSLPKHVRLVSGTLPALEYARSHITEASVCNANARAFTPTSRFRELTTECTTAGEASGCAVQDRLTKLYWKRCSEGAQWTGSGCEFFTGNVGAYETWVESLTLADNAVYAGFDDWRLPNVKELAHTVEYACRYSSINPDIFVSESPRNNFWSSTPASRNTAWQLDVDTGGIGPEPTSESLTFRLVRDDTGHTRPKPECTGDVNGNSEAEATGIVVPSTRSSALNCEGDVDYFAFSLPDGVSNVQVISTGTTPVKIRIFDSDGVSYSPLQNTSNTVNVNQVFTLVSPRTSTRTFVIKLEGRATTTTGDYGLEVKLY